MAIKCAVVFLSLVLVSAKGNNGYGYDNYPNGPGNYPTGPGHYPNGPGNYPSGSGNYPNGPGNYPSGAEHYPIGPGHHPSSGAIGTPGAHPGCPLCDSSVYSYCSYKQDHDSCCCENSYLPYYCRKADCTFLFANSCKEYRLISNCCCIDVQKKSAPLVPLTPVLPAVLPAPAVPIAPVIG